MSERLSDRALGRATLARQGLLTRLTLPVVEAVEQVGALQAQQWSGPPLGLWSRVGSFTPADLYAALDDGGLVTGPLVRGTLHLVSARERPEYEAVAAAVGGRSWWRTKNEPSDAAHTLRREVISWLAEQPRDDDEVTAYVEKRMTSRRGVLAADELTWQREHSWRPFRAASDVLRVPSDGRWGPAKPTSYLGVPADAPMPDAATALAAVIRRHLRAFGPASADDIAYWIGWSVPKVRAALDRDGDLDRLADIGGATLYDLPGAPRPGPDADAPVRLLPWFDGMLLAYSPKRRARVLPDAMRDAVYSRANLQVRPVVLVDGFVAGTWTVQVRGRKAALAVQALRKLTRAEKAAVEKEATALLAVHAPEARSREVAVTPA